MLVSLNRVQYIPQFKSHRHKFLPELEHLAPDEIKLFLRAKFLELIKNNERLTAVRVLDEAQKRTISNAELNKPLSPAEQVQLTQIKQKAKAAMAALKNPATKS